MSHWNEYLEKTKSAAPRALLVEAVGYAQKGCALDLGCGTGSDTRFLITEGFEVTSVDANEGVHAYLPNAVIAKFENFDFPQESYTLVNAQYALPFCHPESISEVMEKIEESLVTGGVFVGQFFGPEDTWARNAEMNFKTGSEIHELFKNYNILRLKEVKEEKPTAVGDPHFWHVFHVIARKK